VSAAKRKSSAKKKRKAASPTGQAAVLGEYRTRWREVHAAYSAMQLRPLTLDETHLFGRILGSIIRGEDIREYFGTVPPIRRGRRSINSDRDLWISMHYWGMMELDKKDEIVRPLVAKSWGISESRVFERKQIRLHLQEHHEETRPRNEIGMVYGKGGRVPPFAC
jgi:hypothetical protein